MRHFLLFVCIQLSLLASFAGETINFCKDWKFYLGDAGEDASSSLYNDSQWRTLNIPHDWSIEGTLQSGKEGKILPAVIYTNCDAVELFINDVSLDSKPYTGE